MTIDAPRPDDLPVLKQIWQEAFGDSETFLDGFFQTGFSYDRCRCLFWEDRPVAVLYWFDCFLEEKKLAYIYAVATDKAYRGRGLCRDLMENTHRQLKTLGYSAAALVPGSEKLFFMYENMGYRRFCPMEKVTVTAGFPQLPVEKIPAPEYFRRRRDYLPENGILQDTAAGYLETFTEFYAGDRCIMCFSREDSTLYFQEFLGDSGSIPGILTALRAETAVLYLPGGKEYAMYLPLWDIDLTTAYLGITLG